MLLGSKGFKPFVTDLADFWISPGTNLNLKTTSSEKFKSHQPRTPPGTQLIQTNFSKKVQVPTFQEIPRNPLFLA